MTPIDILVSKHGWMLQVWDDNHSRGVWAMVGPVMLHVDAIRDMIDSSDYDVSGTTGLLLGGACEWLPTVTAKTPSAAIDDLNAKLEALPSEQIGRDTVWGDAVFCAYERLIEMRGKPGALGAVESGKVSDSTLIKPLTLA